MTHDYKRNGTTDLFAALNVATGEVLTHCRADRSAAVISANAVSVAATKRRLTAERDVARAVASTA